MIVEKLIKRARSFDTVLSVCAPYILVGQYKLSDNLTVLSLDEKKKHKIKVFADDGGLKTRGGCFKKKLLNVILKKTYTINSKQNGSIFHGTSIVISSSNNRYKIFDFDKKEILTKYLDQKDFEQAKKTFRYVNDLYSFPNISTTNDNELYTIEEYIKHDKNPIDSELVLKEIIELYSKNVSKYERKGDLIKCHGDLWSSNIIFHDKKIYFIDFESVGYYSFFYDIFHYMFSEALLNKNTDLLNKYFDGFYDDILKKYFSKFDRVFSEDKRIYYFISSLEEYKSKKWATLRLSDKKSLYKQLDIFLSKLNYSSATGSFTRGILRGLECNGISYVVLRGFRPISIIDSSKDVDIYIPYQFKKRVRKYFNDKGWYHQKINCCRYPHEQYIFMTKDGLKKIDVVYGIFYGNKLFHDNKEKRIMDRSIKLSGINVLSDKDALEELVLHICFDKGILSADNHQRLEVAMEEYGHSGDSKSSVLIKIAEKLIGGQIDFSEYKKQILKTGRLSRSTTRTLYFNSKQIVNNYFRTTLVRLRPRNVCLIGVDGSGKSTLAAQMKEVFGGKVILKYMGFKDFQISFVRKRLEEQPGRCSRFGLVIDMVFEWLDFWKRYLSVRFRSEFVIFDRYPDEAVINSRGVAHILSFILFKILFPNTRRRYYLYCDAKTSLSRKDDILDEVGFVEKKKRFDAKYLDGYRIKSFSSDEKSTEEILDAIINDFNRRYLKYLI